MAGAILITGFGPFGAVRDNPSAVIAARLDGMVVGGRRIVGEILPVEIENLADRLAALVERVRPAAVIQFGVAETRTRLSLERCAVNRADFSIPDVQGVSWRGRALAEDAPPSLRSSLPLSAIADVWRSEGIAFEFSDDAGRYLCNASFYLGLRMAERFAPALPWGFIHMPLPRAANPESLLTLNEINRAALLAAEAASLHLSPTVIA